MWMRYDWIANGRFVAVMLFLSLTLVIVGNALFLQPDQHPAPLFFTRSTVTLDSARRAPMPVAREPGARRSGESRGRPPSAQPTTAAQPKARPAGEPAPRADPIVLAIQQALADAAYGPVTIDGVAGQQTADAIRRFQLDQGLSVTGEIDDRLISRLISVGAMAQN